MKEPGDEKLHLLPFRWQNEWKEPWNEHLRTSYLVSIQMFSSALSMQHNLVLALLPHFLLPLPGWQQCGAPPRWKQRAGTCTKLKVEKCRVMGISIAWSSQPNMYTRAHIYYIWVGVAGREVGTDPTGRERGVSKVVINWHREFSFKET